LIIALGDLLLFAWPDKADVNLMEGTFGSKPSHNSDLLDAVLREDNANGGAGQRCFAYSARWSASFCNER
jgi:hypothetical protein